MQVVVTALITVTGLFGWASLLSWRLARPLGATLLPSLAIALLGINLGLVLGVPLAARVTIVGGGVLALAITLSLDRRAALLRLAAPAPVLVMVGIALLTIGNAPASFVEWDEFSHWGKVAKFIAIAGTYPTPGTYAGFLDYPFGFAAFQALFAWPGTFSEPVAMVAHAFVALACLAAILERCGWRDWPFVLAMAAVVVIGRYFFLDHPWSSILPDTLIGLVAAAAAAIYWRSDGDWKGVLLAAPIVLALPFQKDVGQVLAVVLLAVMALDQLVRLAVGRPIHLEVTAIATVALLLVAAKAVWAHHLEAIGATATFSRSADHLLARLAATDFGANTARIVRVFLDNLAATPIDHRRAPTLPVWLAVIGLVAALATVLAATRQAASRIILANLALTIGFLVYAGGLLALYVFSFSVYEGAHAASFARYMGTFIVFWLVANLAFLPAPPYDGTLRRIAVPLLLVVLAALAIRTIGPVVRRDLANYAAGTPGGKSVPALRETVRGRLGEAPAGSLQLIWTGTRGAEYYIGAFELSPRLVTMPSCFSPGPARFDGDIWSCNLTPEALGALLASRDHLALGAADEVFWERYDGLFADGARQSGAVWFAAGPDGRLAPLP